MSRVAFLTCVALGFVFPASAWAAPSKESPLVTFSGLRVYEDGSATLVVNLTEKTNVSVSSEGTRIEFVMEGARVHLKNNKNPLRAEYFRSNVVRAKLDDVEEGVRLRVVTRSEVAPRHTMEQYGTTTVLRIDFPPPA